jgi:hypothetical protein
VLGFAPLSAAPVSAPGRSTVLVGAEVAFGWTVYVPRHVVVEAGLPATVQAASDAVYFRAPVRLPAGGPVDLSQAAAVSAVFRDPAGVRVTAAAVVEDAAGGLVRVETPVGYLPAAGRWQVQVVVTWADGGVYYAPPARVRVRANA